MKQILLATAVCAAALALVQPASARLQLSINANGSTATCFDGQLGCDQSGGLNNLLVVNENVGGALVQIALAISQKGPDVLQLSSSGILNESGKAITIKLLASDTDFLPPVVAIKSSASLTFNDAIGSGASTLQFWADAGNVQGANPSNTPGTLLETVSGTPVTNPDSFSGSRTTAFSALAPFSMTEGASLNLVADGSITGFNESMRTAPIPETSTWVMLVLGFTGLMFGASARKRLRLY